MNKLDFIKSKNFGAQSESVLSRKTTHKIGVTRDNGPGFTRTLNQVYVRTSTCWQKHNPPTKVKVYFFSREDP